MLFNKSVYFIIGALVAFYVLKYIVPRLVNYSLDLPNNRSSHSLPTPRGGGVSFVFVSSAASALALFLWPGDGLSSLQITVAPLVALPLAFVGFLDDRHNLPATWRYGVQLATALIVILLSPLVPHSVGLLPLSGLLLVIAITAVINFTNFMDGIDGLLCGSMIVIFATINLQFHFLSPVIGALTAFIYFNWYPSKMFMGDSGSLYLGTFLVSLIYSSPTYINLIKILLLCSPLLIDSFVCIVRRIINKQNIFKSHKLHLYQRLVSNGMSHSKVSLFYISSITILGLVYTFAEIKYLLFTVLFIILLGFLLDKKYALDFNY